MPWPHNLFLPLCLLAALGAGRVCAAPAPSAGPAPAAPAPTTPAAIPNYGGRDSAPPTAQSGPVSVDAGPAAQAGRAVEALVLVLAGVVGVVYALKRFGLVQGGADGRPARILFSSFGRSPSAASGPASAVTVESSRTLPGGAMLHVVRVPGRTLLLAATGHTVTAVAEWPPEANALEGADAAAFEDYLARAEAPDTSLAAANARLRSLLSRPQPPKDNP